MIVFDPVKDKRASKECKLTITINKTYSTVREARQDKHLIYEYLRELEFKNDEYSSTMTTKDGDVH